MKTLIIWNENSQNSLQDKIDSNIEYEIIITKVSFLNIINKKLIKQYSNIFILVELNWEAETYYGYSVAKEIISNWDDDSFVPNIEFVSSLDRKQLFHLNSGVKKFFVKSFSHNLLPLTKKFETKKYSVSKWRYLKKYALQKLGILDKIKHDLEKIIKKTEEEVNFAKEKETYLNRLRNLESILGKDLLNKINEQKKNDVIHLNEIYKLLVKRIGELSGNININYDGRKEKIILVEDDKSFGEKIYKILSYYFDVDYYEEGSDAMDALLINNLNYQALITDLELLDKDNIDQDVQGVELLELANNEYPHIVKRVITGLPRRGVKELIDINLENIIYKSLIDYFGFDDSFKDWIFKLKEEIRKYSKLIYQIGPDGAVFGDYTNQRKPGGRFKRFFYRLKIEDELSFNQMWERVYEKAFKIKNEEEVVINTTFIRDENMKKLISENNTDEAILYLEKLLTHRLICLIHYNTGDNVVYWDAYKKGESYKNKAFWERELRTNPKNYFANILGFSIEGLYPSNVSSNSKKVTFNFKSNQLFQEEVTFLQKYGVLEKNNNLDDNFILQMYYILTEIYQDSRISKDNIPLLPENYYQLTETDIDNILGQLEKVKIGIGKIYDELLSLEEDAEKNKISVPKHYLQKMGKIMNNAV